jgi:multidrug efflux pump subunit AcrA (membrane-fusion protein)
MITFTNCSRTGIRCGFFLLAFTWSIQSFPVPSAPPAKAPIVFTETSKQTEIFDVLTYPARIVPMVNANLLSETDGIVDEIIVALGSKVRRGQKLILLRNTDPIYQYAPSVVESPVSGVVSSIEVTKGSRITRGQKLGTVTDPSKIKVSIEVAASDLDSIQSGLEGALTIPNQETTIPAKVMGVSPFVDPATGTASAEIRLLSVDPSKVRFSPGLVGKIRFKTRAHRGFQLPDSAITFRGVDPFIRTVKGGKAKYQPVKVGRTRRGQVEILSGLQEGEIVIARTSGYISDGEAVTLETSEAQKLE